MMSQGDATAAEAALLSGHVEKAKHRAWKICKCGSGWTLIGLLLVIIGIILLAYYAQYWSDKDHWERGLAYTGLVFMLLGMFILIVGILFCVALYWIYKRINGPVRKPYKSPIFAPGTQPYPVQPTLQPDPQPNQPAAPQAQPSAPSDVKIEVEERTNF